MRSQARSTLVRGPRVSRVISLGGHPHQLGQDAGRVADVVQVGHLDFDIAQSRRAVDLGHHFAHRIERGRFHRHVRGRATQPRPLGRIEVLDDRLHVSRRGPSGDAAGRRRQAHQIDFGIEQGDGNRQGVTDSGIGIDNQLLRQWGSFPPCKPLFAPAVCAIRKCPGLQDAFEPRPACVSASRGARRTIIARRSVQNVWTTQFLCFRDVPALPILKESAGQNQMSGGRRMLIVQHRRKTRSPLSRFPSSKARQNVAVPLRICFLIPRPSPLTPHPSFRHG